ncbi:MAG: cupredoxin domain-containing protein [Ilumatobacteraceae bacterium]
MAVVMVDQYGEGGAAVLREPICAPGAYPAAMKHITGSILVCAAAASFAGGALLFADDSSPAPAAPAVAASAVPADAAAAAPVVITIAGFGFSAATVAPGATVTVTNTDSVPHTVTATNGEFSSGIIDPGASVTFAAPAQPGAYTYFCEVHPSMQATLTVA